MATRPRVEHDAGRPLPSDLRAGDRLMLGHLLGRVPPHRKAPPKSSSQLQLQRHPPQRLSFHDVDGIANALPERWQKQHSQSGMLARQVRPMTSSSSAVALLRHADSDVIVKPGLGRPSSAANLVAHRLDYIDEQLGITATVPAPPEYGESPHRLPGSAFSPTLTSAAKVAHRRPHRATVRLGPPVRHITPGTSMSVPARRPTGEDPLPGATVRVPADQESNWLRRVEHILNIDYDVEEDISVEDDDDPDADTEEDLRRAIVMAAALRNQNKEISALLSQHRRDIDVPREMPLWRKSAAALVFHFNELRERGDAIQKELRKLAANFDGLDAFNFYDPPRATPANPRDKASESLARATVAASLWEAAKELRGSSSEEAEAVDGGGIGGSGGGIGGGGGGDSAVGHDDGAHTTAGDGGERALMAAAISAPPAVGEKFARLMLQTAEAEAVLEEQGAVATQVWDPISIRAPPPANALPSLSPRSLSSAA